MSSQIDICNRALSVIGTRSSIASMSEDSPEARACTTHFDAACRAMLRLAPWSFARAVVPGALLASAPGTPENPNGTAPFPLVPTGANPVQLVPWLYEYAWPQDCIKLRSVMSPTNTVVSSSGTVVPFWPGIDMSNPIMYTNVDLTFQNLYQICLDKDSVGNQIKVILTNIQYALVVYTAFVDNTNLWDDEFSEAFVFMLAGHLVGALVGDKQMDKMLYQKAQEMAMVARAVDANEQPESPNHTPDWIAVRDYAECSGYWRELL